MMRSLSGLLTRVLVVLALSVGALSTPANAAAPEFIGLVALRQLLAANPAGIPGYFLTVAGGPAQANQAPVKVQMTVRAVADGQGPDGALILFEADMTDPVMKNIGGIASGMSGSPLYIEQGGTFKVIGALSYGDVFTLNGLGLATPIEYMIDTQTDFPAVASTRLSLPDPVHTTSAGTIERLRITTGVHESTAKAGTVVLSPLFGMQATGLPASSPAYKNLAAATDNAGIRLFSPGASPCEPGGFSTTFGPGVAIGTYLSLGSFAFGGFGTTTYVDGDAAMAFGHPLLWTGRSDAFVTNVWTQGIWGSAMEPYKLGCPGALRGVMTQDRSAGIAANLARTPVEIPATSTVTVTDDQSRTRAGTSQIAPITFSTEYGPPLAAAAVSEPIYRAANQQTMSGSARTLTTVVVRDGATESTITRRNVWDSQDALYEASNDTAFIVSALTSVPGVRPQMMSIDLQADIDREARAAQIVGVRAAALHPGANLLTVTIKPVGKPKTEVPVTISLPSTVPLDGSLTVMSGVDALDSESTPDGPQSVAELVDWVQQTPTNNEIVVQYQGNADPLPLTVGRASTDYALTGSVYPSAADGSLLAELDTVELGQEVRLDAMLSGPPDGTQIALEALTADSSTWQTIGTSGLTTTDGVTSAVFYVTPEANTTYRASWPGDGDYIGWAATADVAVVPAVSVEGKRSSGGWKLSVSSAPQAAGTAVKVQSKQDGQWGDVVAGTLGIDGSATLTWKKAPAKAKVRAVLAATPRFGGTTSVVTTLTTTSLSVDTSGPAKRRGNVTIGLRSSGGKAITGVRYRVQRQAGSAWTTVANGSLVRSTRVWLANGDYRVVVPRQKRVPSAVREMLTMDSAVVLLTKVAGGRGRASIAARPQIPLRFTVQQRAGDQWRTVGPVRSLTPPRSRWSRRLDPGRYRFAFAKQSGFDASVSKAIRVR